MIELYGLSSEIRIFYSGMLSMVMIMQTILLLLLFSHKEYKVPLSSMIHEILMLLYYISTIMLISITLIQRNIVGEYFYSLRYISLALIVSGIYTVIKSKEKEPVVCSVMLFLILPFWSYGYIKYFFLLTNLYLTIRCLLRFDREWQRIREGISRLSIKDALDVFPGGILFTNEKGRIMIINPVMQRLLAGLGVDTHKEMSLNWDRLTRIRDSYNVSIKALDDKLLIRIRNAGSWLFSKQPVLHKNKKFTQLLAVDITDEDVLTRELEESNKALIGSGQELERSFGNIEQLEKEREILRMKTRVHDILAQRLSILSRLLDSEMESKDIIKIFKPLLVDLTQAITDNTKSSPGHTISSLIDSFAMIGTKIHIDGVLPDDQKTAEVFSGIIRECATNAVRHADAKNVYLRLVNNERGSSLSVCNDGALQKNDIIEGGGIMGMRAMVAQAGGEMSISVHPRFCIDIYISGKGKDEL